ncbi:MAG: VWA domain-containing protein [Pseudobutyrivibrio sp.]|nr:VWA domain-containing protein [Pseudobutyrivibrio sp.]
MMKLLQDFVFQPIFPVLPLAIIAGLILLWLIVNVTKKKGVARWEKTLRITIAILAVLLIIGIDLRPMKEVSGGKNTVKNLDVLFCIDTTMSMWALDPLQSGCGTRYDQLVETTNYIMDNLNGANFGLVKFENTSKIIAPFTSDVEDIKDAISVISMPSTFYSEGTSLNPAFIDMQTMISYSKKKENRKTMVVFISDGEVTNEEEMMDFSPLAESIDIGAVIGLGSPEGGKMMTEYNDYIYDYTTHQDAVSIPDTENLSRVAQMLGIEYIQPYNPSECDVMIEKAIAMSRDVEEDVEITVYDDYYQYLLWPLMALLAVEVWFSIRRKV